jgi:methyltransferase-like protein/SAM-dependent methyltransferase
MTESEQTAATSYDVVTYPSKAFRQTHPDVLATIGTLFGLKPAPVTDCRVLEIGCASGDNIIPMAEQRPGSLFVGIDLSQRQLKAGQDFLRTTGLTNIDLRHLDVLDVGPDLGSFDYIIVHGVYSWVPPTVQDAILRVCADHLAEHGIAYVSYNTYPGWHMRGMIRDMMLYHARRFKEPGRQVQQARSLLDFLAKHAPEKTPYGQYLRNEVNVLRNCEDGYLYHDHLEEYNTPDYFCRFMERAAAQGLEYLGEVPISSMCLSMLPDEISQTLNRICNDWIQVEQYMDFLRNRTFRQTLLCHKGLPIDRELRPNILESLWLRSSLVPTTQKVALRSADEVTFRLPGSEQAVATRSPLIKAAFLSLLRAYPQCLVFPELYSQACRQLQVEAVRSEERVRREKEELGRMFLMGYLSGMVDLRTAPLNLVGAAGPKPRAGTVARAQAVAGQPYFTNLAHEARMLSDTSRSMLPYLDGERDRAGLSQVLAQQVREGKLTITQEPGAAADGAEVSSESMLAHAVERALRQLGAEGFLVS